MTSIAFIIDFITYFSVFCFVFHLKLKKSVLHISLGCAWAVLGSCFLYLYSPDFSYRIIILFGLYLLFQAKLDHVLVCFSLYTLISYLAECYGLYFYSLLTGTNVLDNPLILSLCRIFVSLFFLLLCIPFYRGTVTIFPFSRLSAKKNLFISGLCFLHLGLMGILNAFFNYDMSTVGRRLMVILTLILAADVFNYILFVSEIKKEQGKIGGKITPPAIPMGTGEAALSGSAKERSSITKVPSRLQTPHTCHAGTGCQKGLWRTFNLSQRPVPHPVTDSLHLHQQSGGRCDFQLF